MKTKNYRKIAIFLSAMILLGSCAKERSTSTGWEYNNYQNGGFEKFDAKEQETGPGLVPMPHSAATVQRLASGINHVDCPMPER